MNRRRRRRRCSRPTTSSSSSATWSTSSSRTKRRSRHVLEISGNRSSAKDQAFVGRPFQGRRRGPERPALRRFLQPLFSRATEGADDHRRPSFFDMNRILSLMVVATLGVVALATVGRPALERAWFVYSLATDTAPAR